MERLEELVKGVAEMAAREYYRRFFARDVSKSEYPLSVHCLLPLLGRKQKIPIAHVTAAAKISN
jgi:hypothetical protein